MASAKERDGSLTRTTRLVLTISAAIEGATAIAIILNPEFVFQLVLGTGLSSAGIAVARVAAFGLLALAVRALFVYNLLAGLYLGYLRVAGEFAGYLLWPACFLHVVLALLLARPACVRKLRFEEM